jgi:hypothetical protein
MTHQLCEPILDKGLRNTNFFNGRLLAAEDLRTQQEAERLHRGQLGRALGPGVVNGLEVQTTPSTDITGSVYGVTIGSGLAINAGGQPLELPVPVDLALAVPPTPGAPRAGQFTACATETPLQATGMGMYALLMAPASGFLQNAPMSGLGANGAITGCGARFQVEGVTFRLARFDPASLPGLPPTTLSDINNLMARTNLPDLRAAPATDQADLSLLRNRVAHACLGTGQLAVLPMDPLGPQPHVDRAWDGSYGALDALTASGDLTPDDVPLAIVYWTLVGVRFVDMWSLRRRPSRPRSATTWPALLGDRQRVEAEAMLQQFQQQVDALIASNLGPTDFSALRAIDYFRYLPPAGLLPLGMPGFAGIAPASFFAQQPHREPEFVDERLLRDVLETSLAYDRIDLASGELIWLYRTWQDAFAADRGSGGRPYLIFTSGLMPHQARARFDLARWDYSNFVQAD